MRGAPVPHLRPSRQRDRTRIDATPRATTDRPGGLHHHRDGTVSRRGHSYEGSSDPLLRGADGLVIPQWCLDLRRAELGERRRDGRDLPSARSRRSRASPTSFCSREGRHPERWRHTRRSRAWRARSPERAPLVAGETRAARYGTPSRSGTAPAFTRASRADDAARYSTDRPRVLIDCGVEMLPERAVVDDR